MLVIREVTELHQPLLGDRVRLGALQDRGQQSDGDGGIELIDEGLLRGGDEAILRVVLVDDETEAVRDVVRCSSNHGRCTLPASAHRRGRSPPADGYAAPS